MQNLRNKLIAGGVVVMLAAIGTVMNRQAARAADPPPSGPTVTIGAPIPLPVTGTVTATGTVAATQSGTWNVGVTGTPNVNVTNPATAPVLVLNVNDPGRIPFEDYLTCLTGPTGCRVRLGPVPADHRLVVEHISGSLFFSSPTYAVCVANVLSANPLPTYSTTWNPPPSLLVNASYLINFDQPVRFYMDQNVSASLVCAASSNTIESGSSMSVSGYLLDCKVAPCAAIASF